MDNLIKKNQFKFNKEDSNKEFKERKYSLIPDTNNIYILNLIKDKKLSRCLYKLLISIEETIKTEQPEYIEQINLDPTKLPNNQKILIKITYDDFGYGISRYSINNFMLFLKEFDVVDETYVENIINQNKKVGIKKIPINKKYFKINGGLFYALFQQYIPYLYNTLFQNNLILFDKNKDKMLDILTKINDIKKTQSIEETLILFYQIKYNFSMETSVEDAIRSLHLEKPKQSDPQKVVEAIETDSKVTALPKRKVPPTTSKKGKNPNAPTDVFHPILNNDEETEEDEDENLELSTGVID